MHELVDMPELTETGLTLSDQLDFDEWCAIGARLGKATSGLSWAIGDWVSHGFWTYGKRDEEGMAATGLAYDTLDSLHRYVAERFENLRRRRNLSWSHHREVAALDKVDQELWLDRAEREKLAEGPPRGGRRGEAASRSLRLPDPVLAELAADRAGTRRAVAARSGGGSGPSSANGPRTPWTRQQQRDAETDALPLHDRRGRKPRRGHGQSEGQATTTGLFTATDRLRDHGSPHDAPLRDLAGNARKGS